MTWLYTPSHTKEQGRAAGTGKQKSGVGVKGGGEQDDGGGVTDSALFTSGKLSKVKQIRGR